jgi:hypothetical protein
MIRSERSVPGAALWLALLCAPAFAATEVNLDAAAAMEEQLHGRIATEQAARGTHSDALIPLFLELGQVYRQSGLPAPAIAAFEEARGVVRANHGLSSLEEAPLLVELIDIEEGMGFVAEPWEREQQLLALADAHRDDLRAVDIYRRIGDKRMHMLARYLADEFPPQLVLGCYYHRAHWGELAPIYQGPESCAAGSRSELIRAVTLEALQYYTAAVKTLFDHEQFASSELRELEQRLVSGTYDIGAYSYGRQSLQRLLSYDVANGAPPLARVDSLLKIADWDMVRTQMRHDRVFWDSAIDTYEQAYAKLQGEGVDAQALNAMFAPAVPFVLPTFLANPLASSQTTGTTGHIDVAFEVTRFGRARRIEILDSTQNASRDEKRTLVERINRSVFRPIVVDGRVAVAARVEVRYYVGGRASAPR